MIQTAINEEALAHLSREERSVLAVILRTAREQYRKERDELGEQWEGLAHRTFELVARDGIDV